MIDCGKQISTDSSFAFHLEAGLKHHLKSYFSNQALNRNCKRGDKYFAINYFLLMTVFVSLLMVLTEEMNLQHLFVKKQVVQSN